MIRDDYAVLNQGQLKAVARLYYDRLTIFGFTGAPLTGASNYPWTADTSDDDGYAAANLGQLKYVFSYDLNAFTTLDSDADQLADVWERYYFGNLSRDGSDDFDGDGMGDLSEVQQGLNPVSADTDCDGMNDGYELANGLNPLLADGSGDLDGDGVRNDEDARPNNNAIGYLTVTISAPVNGAVFE